VRPALLRSPCIVSFSGGRDSSLVLAAAVDVARREGLPPPVPVTARVAGDAQGEEHEWQERVVRHLRLDDWVRVRIDDELECIGPVARRTLVRHGILWPANVHFHVPQLERAAGGTLLTGIGGDEIFSASGWQRVRRVLAGRAAPVPRDALRLAAALSPHPLRQRVVAARNEIEIEWLTPHARRAVLEAIADESAREPVTWRRRFGWLLAFRYLELCRESLAVLASAYDVEVRHPLLDPVLAGTLASLPRRRRFESRTGALTTLFGEILPPGIASRTSKAVFGGTLWGDASRSFAAEWDGSGADPAIVDVEALKRRWRAGTGEGSYTLLQSLWLERERTRQASSSAPSSSSSAALMVSQERGRRSSSAGNALR
jgi:asparagine synthase (glutamine-hydrolysing)